MSEIRAVRGGRAISTEELQAHIALAMRLENVGVLLGAGASLCAGGGTIRDAWEDFTEKSPDSKEWLSKEGFSCEENLEQLLDQIQIAEREWARQNERGRKLRALRVHHSSLYRSLIRAALLNTAYWRKTSSISHDDGLFNHRQLLTRLVMSRRPGQPEPWIFTTNYDLAVEWATESMGLHIVNGFSGIHHRTFSPNNFDLGFRNTQTRGEARFGTYHVYLVKLHGSLTWMAEDAVSVREMSCSTVFPIIENFLSIDSGGQLPGLMILPGASKYVETSAFVYGELIRRFSEFLARSQTCLLVNGYGFADKHINRILASALQNPTLHLILYVPGIREQDLGKTRDCVLGTVQREFIQFLLESKLPQVTIVGGEHKAYFNQFVNDLPEPVLLDDEFDRVRKLSRVLQQMQMFEQALARDQVAVAQEDGDRV